MAWEETWAWLVALISEEWTTTSSKEATKRTTGTRKVKRVSMTASKTVRTEENLYLRIKLSTRDNGKTTSGMDLEPRFGQMVPNTMVGGRTIKLTVKEYFTMSTVTSTKESGKETKHTDMESILTATEQPMKVSGRMTCSTAMV